MKQKLKEYCDWLEDLTIAGDTINSKGLQKWITEYAKEYHTKQLTLTDVGCSTIHSPYLTSEKKYQLKKMEELGINTKC